MARDRDDSLLFQDGIAVAADFAVGETRCHTGGRVAFHLYGPMLSGGGDGFAAAANCTAAGTDIAFRHAVLGAGSRVAINVLGIDMEPQDKPPARLQTAAAAAIAGAPAV